MVSVVRLRMTCVERRNRSHPDCLRAKRLRAVIYDTRASAVFLEDAALFTGYEYCRRSVQPESATDSVRVVDTVIVPYGRSQNMMNYELVKLVD